MIANKADALAKIDRLIDRLTTAERERDEARERLAQVEGKPIDMLLFCPRCGEQHIDLPQPDRGWDNPPHRSHECQACKWVWRPADIPTNGVASIKTRGQADKSPEPLKVIPWTFHAHIDNE